MSSSTTHKLREFELITLYFKNMLTFFFLVIVFSFSFFVLGFQPRAYWMIGLHYSTQLCPHSGFLFKKSFLWGFILDPRMHKHPCLPNSRFQCSCDQNHSGCNMGQERRRRQFSQGQGKLRPEIILCQWGIFDIWLCNLFPHQRRDAKIALQSLARNGLIGVLAELFLDKTVSSPRVPFYKLWLSKAAT